MKAVIQRVSRAHVEINGEIVGKIALGIVALIGIEKGDDEKEANFLADKLAFLRIFPDGNQKMNHDIITIGGSVLSISQFTLLANVLNGRRPDFFNAEEPVKAQQLYSFFNTCLSKHVPVVTGVFGANMQISMINDGPVTFIIETKNEPYN